MCIAKQRNPKMFNNSAGPKKYATLCFQCHHGQEAIFIEIVKQIVAVFAADIPHEIAARTAKFSRS